MELTIFEVVSGFTGAAEFNQFFTLVWYFGAFSFSVGLLVRLLMRS